jgi:hypothetical protein
MKIKLALLFVTLAASAFGQIVVPGPLTNNGAAYDLLQVGQVKNAASKDLDNLSAAATNTVTAIAQASSSFNQPGVSAFVVAAKIKGKTELDDLNYGVSELLNRNCFSNNVETIILEPRFGATNHAALFGQPFSASNELYGTWGAQCWHTNFYTAPVGVLSNFTLVVTYVQPAKWLDFAETGDGWFGAYNPAQDGNQFFASLVNTNADSSCVMMEQWNEGTHSGFVPLVLSGGIWNGMTYGQGSNSINVMLTGLYSGGQAAPITHTVYAISVNADGRISGWRNSQPAMFNTGGPGGTPTNLLALPQVSAWLQQLQLGGNFTPWLTNGNLGNPNVFTNSWGPEIGLVQVYNQSCEQNPNIPAASFAFSACLENCNKIVDFVGDSILSMARPAGTAYYNAVPETNALNLLYQAMNPDTYVLNDSCAGMSSVTAMSIGYFPSVINVPTTKYKKRTVFTDFGINEVFVLGLSAADTASNMVQFLTPFLAYPNLDVKYIESGYLGFPASPGVWTQAGNVAKTIAEYAVEQAFPFSDVISWKSLTAELHAAGGSLDAVHIGNMNTLAGYQLQIEFARLLTSHVPFHTFSAGQQLSVSGNPFYWTNIYPYTVKLYLSGGTIGGVSRGGTTITTSSAIPNPIEVSPLEQIIITNTVSPSIWMDSTQR